MATRQLKIGLCVRDLDRSAQLYRELGFPPADLDAARELWRARVFR